MIDIKYKSIYDRFIQKYENIHVNPWHQINKEELDIIYNNLVNKMDINDKYSFKYFMDYIIKRLSGFEDAHTKYQNFSPISLTFKKIDDEVLVSYPDNLRGYSLVSINNVPIDRIINELEDVITYGTEGRRTCEIEKALFNKVSMFGLPSLRNFDELVYKIKDSNGNIIQTRITKDDEQYDDTGYKRYMYGNNTEYKIEDNCLVYNHSSVQIHFKDKIEDSINRLNMEDLSNVDTIIIDLRGNWGGNSALNEPLFNFLKAHADKKLICLTDYRIFSAGRYALRDSINLGATTIGEGISTPINCFGNSHWCNIDNRMFSISECYFNPFIGLSVSSKEEFNEKVTDEIRKPVIFHPDIEVKQTKEDFINNVDTVLTYAINYSRNPIVRS